MTVADRKLNIIYLNIAFLLYNCSGHSPLSQPYKTVSPTRCWIFNRLHSATQAEFRKIKKKRRYWVDREREGNSERACIFKILLPPTVSRAAEQEGQGQQDEHSPRTHFSQCANKLYNSFFFLRYCCCCLFWLDKLVPCIFFVHS